MTGRAGDWALAGGLVGGVIADALLGDPRRGHPVALFGRAAQAVQDRLYADRRLAGVGYTASCVTLALGPALLADYLTRRRPWARLAATAATAWAVTGAASLAAEADRIAAALERGDLAAARKALPALCGRDPAGLGAAELARAVIESVAENTSDAAVAPLVWGALAGPGRAGRLPGGQHARLDGRLPVGAGTRGSAGRRPGSTTSSTGRRPG